MCLIFLKKAQTSMLPLLKRMFDYKIRAGSHYITPSGEEMSIVRQLLEKGAHVNPKQHESVYTPLQLSASSGNKEMADLLLNYGAQANKKKKMLSEYIPLLLPTYPRRSNTQWGQNDHIPFCRARRKHRCLEHLLREVSQGTSRQRVRPVLYAQYRAERPSRV